MFFFGYSANSGGRGDKRLSVPPTQKRGGIVPRALPSSYAHVTPLVILFMIGVKADMNRFEMIFTSLFDGSSKSILKSPPNNTRDVDGNQIKIFLLTKLSNSAERFPVGGR